MKRLWMSAAAIAALASGTALADAQGDQTTTVVVTEEPGAPSITPKNPVNVTLNGGIEGYSGNLASRLSPGPTYGVSIGVDPVRFLGGEIGYSGAVNEVAKKVTGGASANSGPDLMRNGGYVILKPGWTFPTGTDESSSVRPYFLGGYGLDQYDPHGRTGSFGFRSETVSNVPMGAGVQMRAGGFMADARFNYAYQFGNSFATADANPWRYQGELRIGGAF